MRDPSASARATTAHVEIEPTAAGPRIHLTGALDDHARRGLEPRLEALVAGLPGGAAPASLRLGLDAAGHTTAVQLDWNRAPARPRGPRPRAASSLPHRRLPRAVRSRRSHRAGHDRGWRSARSGDLVRLASA